MILDVHNFGDVLMSRPAGKTDMHVGGASP